MGTKLDNTQLAYVAGALDSTGMFRRRVLPNGTEVPYVGLQNGNYLLMRVMTKFTNTRITTINRSSDRMPCSVHCDEKHAHSESTTYRWSVTGAKATVILWNIQPYLLISQDMADDLIQVGLEAKWKSGALDDMVAIGWKLPPMRAQSRARLQLAEA